MADSKRKIYIGTEDVTDYIIPSYPTQNNPGSVVQGKRFGKTDAMRQKAVTEALSGKVVGIMGPNGEREIIKPLNVREDFE